MSKCVLTTKYCQLSDIKLAYTEYGQGETLLLLHPNSMSKEFWQDYQKGLFSNYHTIAVDARCHGESISEDTEVDYRIIGEDIIQFCEKLNLKGCKVLGYSDGAIIALYLSGKLKDYYGKIVAISPNLNSKDIRTSWKVMINVMVVVLMGLKKLKMRVDRELLRTKMMLSSNYLDKETLYEVSEDVLIIYGDKDICYDKHFEEMKSMIPKASFKKISNCTHGLIMKDERVHKETVEHLSLIN